MIGFPKVEEAEQVRHELVTIQQQHLIALEDACVLEHGEDGHVHLKQAINLAATGGCQRQFLGDVDWPAVPESSCGLGCGGWNRSGIRCIERYRHQRSSSRNWVKPCQKVVRLWHYSCAREPPIVWWKVCAVTRLMPVWSRPASATLMRTNCGI